MQLISCHFVGLSQCNQTVISVLLAYRSANGQLSLCWLTTVQPVSYHFVGLPPCNQLAVSLLAYHNETSQQSVCWGTTMQLVSCQFVGLPQCNQSAVSLLGYYNATGQLSICWLTTVQLVSRQLAQHTSLHGWWQSAHCLSCQSDLLALRPLHNPPQVAVASQVIRPKVTATKQSCQTTVTTFLQSFF